MRATSTNASPASSRSISARSSRQDSSDGRTGTRPSGSDATWSISCLQSGPTSSMSAGSSISMDISAGMALLSLSCPSLSQAPGSAHDRPVRAQGGKGTGILRAPTPASWQARRTARSRRRATRARPCRCRTARSSRSARRRPRALVRHGHRGDDRGLSRAGGLVVLTVRRQDRRQQRDRSGLAERLVEVAALGALHAGGAATLARAFGDKQRAAAARFSNAS